MWLRAHGGSWHSRAACQQRPQQATPPARQRRTRPTHGRCLTVVPGFRPLNVPTAVPLGNWSGVQAEVQEASTSVKVYPTNASPVEGWAVALPPKGPLASAESRDSVGAGAWGAGGGGDWNCSAPVPGVLKDSVLLPWVLLPSLSSPTTDTWYCSQHEKNRCELT